MAKVKNAKQRITEFLKTKGLDMAEIKDAFDELESADADLDQLADAAEKNKQWQSWYNQVQPALGEIVTERDQLKAQVQKLQQAGLSFTEAKEVATQAAAQASAQQPNAGFDANKFQQDLTSATSTLMKDVAKYGFRHFKEYGEELDFDAVEKLMGEKKIPFDVSYNLYVEPKREEKRQKDTADKIAQGIKEGMQAEMSKQGVRRSRKRTDDIEPAALDKAAPSEHELRESFLKDLDAETTH